jgi:hypothetical protein
MACEKKLKFAFDPPASCSNTAASTSRDIRETFVSIELERSQRVGHRIHGKIGSHGKAAVALVDYSPPQLA